jgi:short-subunit dehydrogenase
MTVLITGASSGIGCELALIFATHRHDVVLVARSEAKLREVARECGPSGVRATWSAPTCRCLLNELTKRFLPGMTVRRCGRILNLASTAAFLPGPLMAVYYATKAYVLSFSEAIATELEGCGVTVTALGPGPTDSGFESAAHLEGFRLFAGRTLPTSREVAQAGTDALMAGRVVVVPGCRTS